MMQQALETAALDEEKTDSDEDSEEKDSVKETNQNEE